MAGLPPSPAFANMQANAMPSLGTPGVPAGGVNMEVVGREAKRTRKLTELADNLKLAVAGPGGAAPFITDAELGEAVCREAEAVAQVAGPAIAPPWVGAVLEPLLARIANLQAGQNAILASQDAIQAGQDAIQAELHNHRLFIANRRALNAPANQLLPYRALAKTTAGFGAPGVAAGQAAAAVFAAPPPNPGPQTFPPAALRMLENTNDSITLGEIADLSRWYNSTFGIAANDHHKVQLAKFKSFLCGDDL